MAKSKFKAAWNDKQGTIDEAIGRIKNFETGLKFQTKIGMMDEESYKQAKDMRAQRNQAQDLGSGANDAHHVPASVEDKIKSKLAEDIYSKPAGKVSDWANWGKTQYQKLFSKTDGPTIQLGEKPNSFKDAYNSIKSKVQRLKELRNKYFPKKTKPTKKWERMMEVAGEFGDVLG